MCIYNVLFSECIFQSLAILGSKTSVVLTNWTLGAMTVIVNMRHKYVCEKALCAGIYNELHSEMSESSEIVQTVITAALYQTPRI